MYFHLLFLLKHIHLEIGRIVNRRIASLSHHCQHWFLHFAIGSLKSRFDSGHLGIGFVRESMLLDLCSFLRSLSFRSYRMLLRNFQEQDSLLNKRRCIILFLRIRMHRRHMMHLCFQNMNCCRSHRIGLFLRCRMVNLYSLHMKVAVVEGEGEVSMEV